MVATDANGLVRRALRAHGFTPLPRRRGGSRFEGVLACKAGPVRVQLEIEDWEFQDYPVIRVLELPAGVPKLLPHMSASGHVCYFTPGAVVLDRYRPDHVVLQCLQQARDELDRLIADPTYRQAEFAREFGANWAIGQHPAGLPILLGELADDAEQAAPYVIGAGDERYLMIAAAEAEAEALCAVRGWPAPEPWPATCWVLRSPHSPVLGASGLPRTVKEWFTWIRTWDPTMYAAIQRVLGNKRCLALPRVLFLLQCADGWFGVEFALEATKRQAFARKPAGLRQLFHTRAAQHPITRLTVSEVGADYVHGRNSLQATSLKDRHVTLVGAGAIGGYLAQALVKLGAGRGVGQLVLIDPDRLRAGNLGRHLLGYESLLRPKVAALAEMLTRQFPGARITAQHRLVQPSDLRGDLVINATGEETVSLSLNHWRLALPEAGRPSSLHVWIYGNGECTQALWVDSPKHACFRCLRHLDRTPRFNLRLPLPARRVAGCQAFTPYAVSVPMAAAALATDLTIAWLQGDPKPRFRTRMLEGVPARALKNQDVEPLAGCPACARV